MFSRNDSVQVPSPVQTFGSKTDLIKPDQSYPVWSPYNAFEAADRMLKLLQ